VDTFGLNPNQRDTMKITVRVDDLIFGVPVHAIREMEFRGPVRGENATRSWERRKEYMGRMLNECEQQIDDLKEIR
jgi:hypothetical protein